MAVVLDENGFDKNYMFHIQREHAYIHLPDSERVRIVGMLPKGNHVHVVCYPANKTVLFKVDNEKIGLYVNAATFRRKWFEPVQHGKVWAVKSYSPYRKTDLVVDNENKVLMFDTETQAFNHANKLHADFIWAWYQVEPDVNRKWYIWNGLKRCEVSNEFGGKLRFTVAQDALDYIDKLAGGKYESI